jgi:acetyl esterase/lipase
MKQRAEVRPLGVYEDFRAAVATGTGSPEQLLRAAKSADARIVLFAAAAPWKGAHEGVLFLGDQETQGFPEEAAALSASTSFSARTPKQQRGIQAKFKEYPDEVFAAAGEAVLKERGDRELIAAFRNTSIHILARELAEADIRSALAAGRAYTAHDWMCDPTGFLFVAENNLGVYEAGDAVPMMNTRINAAVPVPAKLKLFHNDMVIAEAADSKLSYAVKEAGDYRLEAWLTVDGEDRPWIYSGRLHIANPPSLTLPPGDTPSNVEVRRDIVYVEGDPAEAAKHKLDLYLPKDKKNFPVMVFIHGGAWRSGDRSMYAAVGNSFAKAGIGVAIPSYRLMPKSPHPAQIRDVAEAFAWVYQNAGQYGGDSKRIYLAGHSAGGHLAALLALDGAYLKEHAIPPSAIRGVAALSGVYDVSRLPEFESDKGAPDGSPARYVHPQAPPFLITYCQWDYLGLPRQARDFAAALKKAFVGTQLLYIPGENHIAEIVDIWKDDDPIARAILNFIK